MKNLHTAVSILIILIFVISACKEDNPTEPVANNVKSLTIAHFGVDWSEGKVSSMDGTETAPDPDGETIGWCPSGNGGGWGTGVWYRPFNDKQYKTTIANLSDVQKVDTTLWDDDVCDSPLKNGDIWVAQCKDGYVSFKVIDAPMDSVALANNPMWEVKVEYVFSQSGEF